MRRLYIENVEPPWSCYEDDDGVWIEHDTSGEERSGHLEKGLFVEGPPEPTSLHDTDITIKIERCRCGHLRNADGDDKGHASAPDGLTLAEPCQNYPCDCSDFRTPPTHDT
jgi:hypothetical protein